jgi:hypothetical protein
MRYLAVLALVGLIVLPINEALADPTTTWVIDDTTVVTARTDANGGWADIVGEAPFDIHSITVTYDAGTSILAFDLESNFNGDGVYALNNSGLVVFRADLALDFDGNGTHEYGIVLMNHSTMATSGSSYLPSGFNINDTGGNPYVPGLYSVSDWYTSVDFLGNYGAPNSGYARWYDDAGSPGPTTARRIKVAINTGTPVSANFSGVTITEGPGLPGDPPGPPPYHLKFSIDLGVAGIGSGMPQGVLWGGTTCGNDTIEERIPEPSSLLVLGLGLVGMLGIARMRRRK